MVIVLHQDGKIVVTVCPPCDSDDLASCSIMGDIHRFGTEAREGVAGELLCDGSSPMGCPQHPFLFLDGAV